MRGITRMETCLRDGSYGASEHHVHNECEIRFILRGKTSLCIDSETVTMETGSLLFINRQTAHKTISVSDSSYEYFILCFHPELSSQWQHIVPDIDFSKLYGRSYMLLEPYMMDQVFIQGIVKTLRTAYGAGMQGVFDLKLMELLVYLVIKTNMFNYDHTVKRKGIKKKHYEALTDYIASRDYNVSLEELCRRFYLSRYYICHLFKDEGGMTLNEYINANRIRIAVKLLEDTDLPVTEIVGKCGYDSIGNFGRVFKKNVGVSPREYRKRHRYHVKNRGK